MKLKDSSINILGLQIQMRPVLTICERVWSIHGQELVITSARDSLHSAGSLHYYGLAVDVRTRYFTQEIKTKVFEEIQQELFDLDHRYRVIYHKTHFHIGYYPSNKEMFQF